MDPFITVVMPVRNEARFIRSTLEMLLRQNYPADRFEIIVADGESSDGTEVIVEEMSEVHPQIRLVQNPRRKSSSGRNLGFRLGSGDYFLVVDGHCHIDGDGLLRAVADSFERSGADCLGRPQPLDPPGLTPFQETVALARGSWLGHSRQSLIYARYEGFASPVSNGAAYRRELFRKIGYVDEGMDACEDVEFNYRLEKAGMLCYTSPALTVRYFPRENLPGLFRQMHRYGLGRYRFLQRHPESLHWESLVTPLFALGLFVLLAFAAVLVGGHLAGLPSFAADGRLSLAETALLGGFAFLSGAYTVYLCLIGTAALHLAARHGWHHLPRLVPIFLGIHLGLGFGFLAGVWELPGVQSRQGTKNKPQTRAEGAPPLRMGNGKVSR